MASPIGAEAGVSTKYRTYKKATDKLAGWLATTAGGFSSDKFSKLGALTVSQFSTLTDAIISATPPVDVPLEIVSTARQAYLARQETAVLLRGVGLESDKGHEHVIAVIEQVYRKLSRHYEAARKQKRGLPERKDEADDPPPSFQHLNIESMEGDIESMSSADEEGERVPLVKLSKNKKSKMMMKKKKVREQAKEVYLQDDEEDPSFMLMCLLSDLSSMRKSIKSMWQKYKDGKVDLVTVSLVTNATFDVIRTYDEDFLAISAFITDYSKTIRLLLTRKLGKLDTGLKHLLSPTVFPEGFVPADGAREIRLVGESLSKIPRLADLTLANAFYYLNGPRNVIFKWHDQPALDYCLLAMDPFANLPPPLDDQAQFSAVQQLSNDVRLLALFAQSVYEEGAYPQVAPDHFTMQFRDFQATGDKTITLAQAFGAHLYLDIHSILKNDCDRPFNDLCSAALRMHESFEAWKQNPVQCRSREEGQQQIERNVKTVQILIDHTLHLRDQSMRYKRLLGVLHTRRSTEDMQRFWMSLHLLQMHPLLSGIIMFQMVLGFHRTGNFMTLTHQTLETAGQLYHLCQLQRKYYRSVTPLEIPSCTRAIPEFAGHLDWGDMELIFKMYGGEAFFGGRIPDYFEVAYNLAHKKMPRGLPLPTFEGLDKGPIIEVPTTSEKVVYAKILDSCESIAVTLRLYTSKLDLYLEAWQKGKEFDGWTLETLQHLLNSHAVERQSKTSRKGCANMERQESDVISILQRLKEVLQSDNFDFVSFHISCLNLLRAVRHGCRHLVKDDDIPPESDYYLDSHISEVITMIFINIYHSTSSDNMLRGYVVGSQKPPLLVDSTGRIGAMMRLSFRTDKNHVHIDTLVKRYLDESQCKNKEARKLNEIWGLPSK